MGLRNKSVSLPCGQTMEKLPEIYGSQKFAFAFAKAGRAFGGLCSQGSTASLVTGPGQAVPQEQC